MSLKIQLLKPKTTNYYERLSFFWGQSDTEENLDLGKTQLWMESCKNISKNLTPVLQSNLLWLDPNNEWKNYMFRLFPQKLYYYEDNLIEKPLGVIDFNTAIILEISKFQKQNKIYYSFILSNEQFSQELCSLDQTLILNWIENLNYFTIRHDFFHLYSFISNLGAGSFAEVHKVQSSINQKFYAAKIYSKCSQTKKTAKNIKKEIQLLRLLKGKENFLQLFEVFEEDDCVILITELIEGGDLYKKIKQIQHFTEQQALNIFKQLVNGLFELAELKIVHRDLKLENILIKSRETDLDNCVIKIADFGLSDLMKDGKKLLYTKCGTPGYIAPEMFGSLGYTEKADVFSAGIILYTLINGNPPFKGKNLKQIAKKTKKDKIHFKKAI